MADNMPTWTENAMEKKVITSMLLVAYHYLYCGAYKERIYLNSLLPSDVIAKLPRKWYMEYQYWLNERGIKYNDQTRCFTKCKIQTDDIVVTETTNTPDHYGDW